MSKIPICEAADFINGRAFKPSEWGTEGLPIIRIQNLTGTNKTFNFFNGEINPKNLVRRGDILISWSASLGVYRWTRHDAALNQHIFKVVVKPGVLSSYFYYVATHALSQMVAQVHGSTMQHITKDKFDAIPISLPSQPEQKRIAALLEKADRLRRTRRYARQLSDTFLQSVFLEMFGDPATNSKGWDIEPFEDSLEDIDAGVNFKPIGDNEPASPWRVLKVSAVTSGEFKPFESKPISPDVVPSKKLIVQDGDFLMSRANTVELVGAVCIVRAAPPKVLLPDKLWRVRFATGSKLVPDYALILLQSREMRRRIGSVATGTSGSMKNITQEDAASLLLPVPPLPLQQEFADIVRHFERLRAQQREAERQADHLFQTLLHRAFTSGL